MKTYLSKKFWVLIGLSSSALLALGLSERATSSDEIELLPLVQAYILPDLKGFPAGKGYPSTGLAVAPDGTMWGGIGTRESLPFAGVTQIRAGASELSSTYSLENLGLAAASVQGIAVSSDKIWFIAKNNPHSKLVTISMDGREIRSADFVHPNANGLAYDGRRKALIVLYDDGLVQWIDQNSLLPIGKSFKTRLRFVDHLFYDEKADALYASWGKNGQDGHVGRLNQTSGDPEVTWDLVGADAIEGLTIIDQRRLLVVNDAGTHPGNPALNRLLEYHLPPEPIRKN